MDYLRSTIKSYSIDYLRYILSYAMYPTRNITVTAIYVYPVKGCNGISVTSRRTNKNGFENDRRWMVVDDKNKFLSQRDIPKMALITPRFEVNDNGEISELVLTAKGVEKELRLPLHINNSAEKLEVHIWNDVSSAYDCGKEASTWISSFLEVSAKIVAMPDEYVRLVTRSVPSADELVHEPQVAFADAFPFLLISEESLADLNSRLDTPVTMRNFRPNIVIKGCVTPFEEDTWKKFRIGEDKEHIFHVASRCMRCTVPNINPDTGESDGLQPLKTLMSYRRVDKEKSHKACFGMNIVHSKPGVSINVGDPIEILSTGTAKDNDNNR